MRYEMTAAEWLPFSYVGQKAQWGQQVLAQAQEAQIAVNAFEALNVALRERLGIDNAVHLDITDGVVTWDALEPATASIEAHRNGRLVKAGG